MHRNADDELLSLCRRHLIFTLSNGDLYVLPDGVNLVKQDPPAIASVTSNGDGTVTLNRVLGPHWAKQLGKTNLMAFQASARGGVVRVRVEGDRVILGGQAVTVLRAELAG